MSHAHRPMTLLLAAMITLAASTVTQAQVIVRRNGHQATGIHLEDPVNGTHVWRLWNDQWNQTLEWVATDDDGFVLELTRFDHEMASGTKSWLPESEASRQRHYDVRVSRDGSNFTDLVGPTDVDGFTYKDSSVTANIAGGYVELQIDLERAYDLELQLIYRCYAEGALETSVNVVNRGLNMWGNPLPLWVGRISSLVRNFEQEGSTTESYWRARRPSRETYGGYGYFNVAENTFPVANSLNFHGHIPAVQVMRVSPDDDDGLVAGFILSGFDRGGGPHRFLIQRVDGVTKELTFHMSTDLGTAGIGNPNPSLRLALGSVRRGEWAYLLFFEVSETGSSGLHESGEVVRYYQRNYHRPPLKDGFPRVQLNNYFGFDTDFDYETMMAEATAATSVGGIERIVLDAGWSDGSLTSGTGCGFDKYRFGNGYWFGNECKFDPLAGESLLDFWNANPEFERGLWLVPFGADVAYAETSPTCWSPGAGSGDPCFCDDPLDPACQRWDPSYLTSQRRVCCYPDKGYELGCAVIDCPPENKQLGTLCGAYGDAFDWAKAAMTHLGEDYGATYLKIDGGTGHCNSHDDHDGHARLDPVTQEVVVESTWNGLQRLLTEVRASNPDEMVIESGWPIGDLAFSEDPDNPDDALPYLTRFNLESARWFTPAGYAANYLYGPPEVPQGVDEEQFTFYAIRSRMLGTFAICDKIVDWPSAFRTRVGAHTSFFIDHREFYRGRSYTLISQWEECGGVACTDSWDGVQFLNTTTSEAIAHVFRNEPAPSAGDDRRMYLRGLIPSQDYEILLWGEQPGSGSVASGQFLMDTSNPNGGLVVTLENDWSSEVVRVLKVPPPPKFGP